MLLTTGLDPVGLVSHVGRGPFRATGRVLRALASRWSRPPTSDVFRSGECRPTLRTVTEGSARTPNRPGTSRRFELAECPGWDDRRAEACWVDIDAGSVVRGRLDDDRIEVLSETHVDRTVGAALPAEDGGTLVVASDHLATIDTDGVLRHGPALVAGFPARRFNDAACDPAGRLLVGTMSLDGSRGRESLLQVDGGRVTILLEGLTVSNGLAWSPDGATAYHIDSDPGLVRAFDYDVPSGRLGEPRPLLDASRADSGRGVPDGLCVDVEGCLWIAFWGAGQIRRVSPDGEVIEVLDLPAPHTSSCAFVGPALDRLLVTSARADLTADELEATPASGALFVLDVGVPGLPRHRWAGSTGSVP